MAVAFFWLLFSGRVTSAWADNNGLSDTVKTVVEKPLISPEARERRVIVVVIDRIWWQDILRAGTPNLQQIMDKGAIGVMNTRTGQARLPDHTYLTMGAGSRVEGGIASSRAYNVSEEVDGVKAGELYLRRTGYQAGLGAVVQVELAQLAALNEKRHYPVQLGAIGWSLHQAGLKTAVFGNADGEKEPGRQGVTLAMDDKGMVDYGYIDATVLKKDMNFVTGFRTDYQGILKGFQKYKNQAQLIVIETGDTSRVEDSSHRILDKVFQKKKREALQEADRFLGQLTKELDWSTDRLIIVTPTPSIRNLNEHLWLTPVIMAGHGVGPGLLTSGTTKREGIVSNLDIAATIVDYLGLPQNPNIMGRPMEGMASNLTVAHLEEISKKAAITHLTRPILVKGYVTVQIIVLILAMVTVFWRKPQPRLMNPVLLWLMAVPMVFLLLPILPQYNIWVSIFYTITLSSMVVWASLKLGRNHELYPYIIVCLATVAVILSDTLTGSYLTKGSVLGYDAMEGARYYGIGNEYMGVLIGATIIGATGLLQRFNNRKNHNISMVLVTIFFVFVTYILAAPNLGTNVGGTIAALAGFGLTILLLMGVKPSRKMVVGLVLGIFVVLLVFISYDFNRSPEVQSHIGRTASSLIRGGWEEGIKGATDIITRKLEINFRLIKYTMWSRVFITSIIALAILFYRPVGVMKVLQGKYKILYIGFIGVTVGSLVALIFNDSGIVAAATMMIFGSAPLISLVIKERLA
ncbi:MAG: hypothetical protein ACYDG6_07550 [Thermincolia bacterium]